MGRSAYLEMISVVGHVVATLLTDNGVVRNVAEYLMGHGAKQAVPV